MEDAIRYAANNPISSLPKMAAVIVKDHVGIIGFNQLKTHPLQARFGKNAQSIYLHAEIDAIVNAMRLGLDVEGAEIYIARVLKDGTPALAKPCTGCQKALIHFGFRGVHWTT